MNNNTPRHIGMIMDGNRPWAKSRLLPGIAGHKAGADRVVEIAQHADSLGIEYLLKETFTRSVYTSLTLVFSLVCILLLRPNSISGFTLAMLFGTIVGTYSSIFIAYPLLHELHKNITLTEYVKREALTPEDKMVV